jgi:hypothetical protein
MKLLLENSGRESYIFLSMETKEEQLPARYAYILSLSKPRRVQTNPLVLIIIGSLPLASIFLVYSGLQTFLSLRQASAKPSFLYPAILGLLVPATLIAISSYAFWKFRRDMNLLKYGELAIGVVTHQKLVLAGGRAGRRTQSRIRYRFKDPAGQLFQGTGTDNSKKLLVNMAVPVFYKAEDPEQNVSICTPICELRAD